MIHVSIIGSGNVAHHLIQAFSQSTEVQLVQVFARNPRALSPVVNSIEIVSDFHQLKMVDVVIIAVNDDAIASVSSLIPFEDALVVHTSGTKPMTILNHKNRQGVFYPLQTFSKAKALDFNQIPICLETQNPKDYQVLETIARSISHLVHAISSEQRKALHVAAVFVCNFVNHLYQIGQEICQENQIPFEILKPLILETAEKIKTLPPAEAQTGPAIRGDQQTIAEHLNFLSQDSQKEIYNLLTKSIINHGTKL